MLRRCRSPDPARHAGIYDAVIVVLVIFMSFTARHLPRWLGGGLMLAGVGCFVFALPQLLGGSLVADAQLGIATCPANSTAGAAALACGGVVGADAANLYYVFVIGMVRPSGGALREPPDDRTDCL